MKFPSYAYKLVGPHSFEKGSYDCKIANTDEELAELIKQGFHPDYHAVVTGTVQFIDPVLNEQENIDEAPKKRGRKPKEEQPVGESELVEVELVASLEI